MYCPSCGKTIPEGSMYCSHCGSPVGSPSSGRGVNAAMFMNKKSEALALILSFFITGLGQIYNGQTAKGILILRSEQK